MISVIIRPGTDFTPSVGEFINCPLCHATGEADAELAAEWQADQLEYA